MTWLIICSIYLIIVLRVHYKEYTYQKNKYIQNIFINEITRSKREILCKEEFCFIPDYHFFKNKTTLKLYVDYVFTHHT